MVPAFLKRVADVVGDRYPDFTVLWYGHIGDGNVHLNILKPPDMAIGDISKRTLFKSE